MRRRTNDVSVLYAIEDDQRVRGGRLYLYQKQTNNTIVLQL
jgi:hypothetical protein